MLKLTKNLFVPVLLLLFANALIAQNQESIKDFTLVNEKMDEVSLSDFASQKAVVVVFTSSHCAWATKYQDRLVELHRAYGDKGIGFLAINSNDPSVNQVEQLARMVQLSPFPFPYLKDSDQSVAKALGATRNPEVVLLSPAKGEFQVIYRGKIDDNPIDASRVKEPYLANAIDCLLAGKPLPKQTTHASGCNIQWIREESGE